MLIQILFLFFGLSLILFAAEFFTNGIEAFGKHFSFSQAVIGSIFAAVGTAMPETILPFVAIFMYGGEAAKEIGVGAILGAPFMLSTLAFFLVGVTVSIAAMSRKRKFELVIETESVKRDLIFFLSMYSSAIILPLMVGRGFLVLISLALMICYIIYAYLTFRGESAGIDHSGGMYLWELIKKIKPSFFYRSPPVFNIIIQISVSLLIMVKGAHVFVQSLEQASIGFGMDPLIFSLLLAPVATELPEKFNSVTWTWKGRDTLAIGNITGAMVFQSAFPVSVGLLFTEWNISGMALFSAILAILSSLIILGALMIKKKISPLLLLSAGCLYLVYVLVLIFK